MGLIVQKFGGSSVRDRDRIFNVARIVRNTRNAGNDVVVVVSAQGDTTDDLIAKAAEISCNPSHREMDMLLAAGEEKLSKDRCCSYLTKVGLCANDYLDREVDVSLSGGEVKRIEIATILARHSDLMIFDEPEAGIDLWSFARLTETFEQIHQEGKATMIIISHQERIIRLADEIVVIANGQIAHRGNTDEVFPLILADTLGGCPVIERKEASL